MKKTLLKRFNEKYKINPVTECWEWTASINNWGYGHFRRNNKTDKAHRVSYELFKGPIPKGLCVCHTCDNPKCVNPDHLWLGTFGDNNRDRSSKGRSNAGHHKNHPKGENHISSKLTEQDVKEIRMWGSLGHSTRKLAKVYNIHHSGIGNILTRKTWKHIL